MLEIAVCDDDIADLECAVNMLHKIFTSQKIAYHMRKRTLREGQSKHRWNL